MKEPDLSVFTATERSAWLRLRTLILLRWLAVLGQSAAVLVTWLGLDFALPLDLCALAIGASALFNLIAMMVSPENRRLTEREAVLTLLFDLCQLGFLLYLTGGLANPFALLLLAPVTISASVLSLRATILLGCAATVIITVLVLDFVPLQLQDGETIGPPSILTVGTWASLVIGVVFLALYARRVTGETFSMSQALTATQMALDREQQITALGGFVAAAAHELGTPLATIKLVSTELIDELGDRPDLLEDALLIRAQADRCRDILQAMGPRGKSDALMLTAPLSSVVEEAAAPHADRGVRIITRVDGATGADSPSRQPQIARRPEIIQGLRNLVQNAVDFARSTVWIDIDWTQSDLRVVIGDDGPGYPADLLGRLGDPFVRSRSPQKERPGYAGMGLGLFIAKTLLERSGADLRFTNGSDSPDEARLAGAPEFSRPTGAIVAVIWSQNRVERDLEAVRAASTRKDGR